MKRTLLPHLNAGSDGDDFQSEIVNIMVQKHLHCWHQFRMVPAEVIMGWNIPSLNQTGLQLLSQLPQHLRQR